MPRIIASVSSSGVIREHGLVAAISQWSQPEPIAPLAKVDAFSSTTTLAPRLAPRRRRRSSPRRRHRSPAHRCRSPRSGPIQWDRATAYTPRLVNRAVGHLFLSLCPCHSPHFARLRSATEGADGATRAIWRSPCLVPGTLYHRATNAAMAVLSPVDRRALRSKPRTLGNLAARP